MTGPLDDLLSGAGTPAQAVQTITAPAELTMAGSHGSDSFAIIEEATPTPTPDAATAAPVAPPEIEETPVIVEEPAVEQV